MTVFRDVITSSLKKIYQSFPEAVVADFSVEDVGKRVPPPNNVDQLLLDSTE